MEKILKNTVVVNRNSVLNLVDIINLLIDEINVLKTKVAELQESNIAILDTISKLN